MNVNSHMYLKVPAMAWKRVWWKALGRRTETVDAQGRYPKWIIDIPSLLASIKASGEKMKASLLKEGGK